MRQIHRKSLLRRERGAALITALIVACLVALLLGASLSVALTSGKLAYNQVDSEAAVQLAEAGIDSELQVISFDAGASSSSGRSSQPVVYSGVTAELPNTTTPVLGRPGTVTGYTGGTYYVYSSNDAAGTTAWDGVTSPFYITASAAVNNCWHTVQVTNNTNSAFNQYGNFALGTTPGNTTGVTVASGATVTVSGTSGVNGTVSTGTGSTFTATTVLNADTSSNPTGQFTSSNGSVTSQTTPIIYPTTTTAIQNITGSTSSLGTIITNGCGNNGYVYEYKSSNQDVTLSTANCKQYQKQPSTLMNSCWSGVHQKPFNSAGIGGGDKKIQTMIFEPGDYYFTQIQLTYDSSKELVLDPCAYASGGTPGCIRFFCYDPNAATDGNTGDYIQMPFTETLASGQSTPDPGSLKFYYANDGLGLTFTRPPNILDAAGNNLTSDFTYYLNAWGVSKQAGDTSSLKGTTISFVGTSSASTGGVAINGSVLSDKMSFGGVTKLTYVKAANTSGDPCISATVLNYSKIH